MIMGRNQLLFTKGRVHHERKKVAQDETMNCAHREDVLNSEGAFL